MSANQLFKFFSENVALKNNTINNAETQSSPYGELEGPYANLIVDLRNMIKNASEKVYKL